MDKSQSLFAKSATGVFWVGGSKVIGQVLHVAIRLVLARLLVPEDFGIVAMATVVVSFSWVFLDIGFGSALIQLPELTEEHKSTAFWITVALGIAIFILLAAASPLVSAFYGRPDLIPIFLAMSTGVLFNAPEGIFSNLFRRSMDYRSLAFRDILSVVTAGAVGLGMAVADFGAWALVGYSIAQSLFGSLFVFIRSGWYPKLRFSKEAFGDLWSFSRYLIGARLINYFNRSIDTLLVGRVLGAVALGFYNIGGQFVLMPLIYVARPVTSVLFSTLSRLSAEHGRFENAYLRTMELTAVALIPLGICLSLGGPPLVPFVLGEGWAEAAPLIPYLSIAGIMQAFNTVSSAGVLASGKTEVMMKLSVIRLVILVLCLTVGLRYGLYQVAVMYAAASVVTAPIVAMMHLSAIEIRRTRYLATLARPGIAACVALPIWIVTGMTVGRSQVEEYRVMLQVIAYLPGYAALAWFASPVFRESVMRVLRGDRVQT